MFQILLSNLSIILLAFIGMSFLANKYSKIPKYILLVLNIVMYSAVIIFLFYTPIKIEDFLFDLRAVILLFLAITQGWRVTVPVLLITAIWRIQIIGGPVGLESTIYNMAVPVLIGLFFYQGEEKNLPFKKFFLLNTGIWFITLLPIIWVVTNGFEIILRIAFCHFLTFMITSLVLYGLYDYMLKHKEMTKKIHHMAYHDFLTGIPNRYMLDDYLYHLIEGCKQNNQQLAILFLDLDQFKFINDSKGHSAGDLLLQYVTNRLTKVLRKKDLLSRQGGDEFIILLEDIDSSEVRKMAEKIIELFKKPFHLFNEEIYTTTSIGISMYPVDGMDKETLFIKADKALYLAKKRGKNNYQFFVHQQEELVNRKTKLELGLRRAIETQEFVLYYQPKVELKSGKIYGMEALLRWEHPELGLVPPTEFIPIAEETGMIIQLGKWVLNEASRQNKLWQSKGFHIKMAVNVSVSQFEESNFVETVKEVLHTNQLQSKYLVLEITESVMQNIDQSSGLFQQLKEIGVEIAIDDFGTGYSSLSVLNNLPIDIVKIDKSFVDEIFTKESTQTLIKIIIELGKNFDFELVAEGIENSHQAEFLRGNGCHYGQGYYFSKPLSIGDAEGLLTKRVGDNPLLPLNSF